jgi:hypothetical protein
MLLVMPTMAGWQIEYHKEPISEQLQSLASILAYAVISIGLGA